MTDQVFLVVGRTGNGKSTICNVLSNSTHFGESAAMTSQTAEHTAETFRVAGNSIRLVDTIGIGDNRISPAEVFHLIARACHEVRGGIHQLIFVTRGRLTPEELAAFRIFEEVILDRSVARFTTIVRTDFPDYDDPAACAADIADMRSHSAESDRVFAACSKIVHVYTPPPHRHMPAAAALRADSRTRLLAWLGTRNTLYCPPSLQDIEAHIEAHIAEETRVERELAQTQELLEQARTSNTAMVAQFQEQMNALNASLQQSQAATAEALQKLANTKRSGGLFGWLGDVLPIAGAIFGPLGAAIGTAARKIF